MEVRIIHGVHAVVPVFAAERAPRKRVLDDVEELAVARIDLQLAIVQDVIGATDTRGDLLGVAEADIRRAGAVGRKIFLVEANTGVDRETGLSNCPRVLAVDRAVVSASDASGRVIVNIEVTVVSAAMFRRRSTILRNVRRDYGIAGGGRGLRGIVDAILRVNQCCLRPTVEVVEVEFQAIRP